MKIKISEAHTYIFLKIMLKVLAFFTTFLIIRLVEIKDLLWEYNAGITFAIVDLNLRYVFARKNTIEIAGFMATTTFFILAIPLTAIMLYLDMITMLYFVLFILSNLTMQNLEFTTSSNQRMIKLAFNRIIDIFLLILALVYSDLFLVYISFRVFILAYYGLSRISLWKVILRTKFTDFGVSSYSIFHFTIISVPIYFLLLNDESFWVYRIALSSLIGLVPSLLIGQFSDRMFAIKPIMTKYRLRVIVVSYASIILLSCASIGVLQYCRFYNVEISLGKLGLLVAFNVLVVSNDLLNIVLNNQSSDKIQERVFGIYIISASVFFILFISGFVSNEWQYVCLACFFLIVVFVLRLNEIRWQLL